MSRKPERLLASVMTAAVLAGSAIVMPPALASGPSPAVTQAAAHPPRFYIESNFGRAGTQVRATATGKVTASVRCPWAGSEPGSMAAQGDNRTFFVACQKFLKTTTGVKIAGTRIFRFRLTSAGTIPGYSAVRGGAFNGEKASGIAASWDGSLIAVNVAAGTPGGGSSIVVIKAKTGSRARWQGRDLAGGVRFSGGDLSFADGGTVLAVFGRASCRKGDASCKSPGEEMLALSPAARGGRLAAGRVVFRQGQVGRPSDTFINDAYLSADGSKVTLSLLGDGPPPDSVSVVQLSAATGRPVRTLFKLITGNGFSYQFVTTDPSGQYVLFNAGPTSGTVFGWIDHGKLAKLKPAGSNIVTGAW